MSDAATDTSTDAGQDKGGSDAADGTGDTDDKGTSTKGSALGGTDGDGSESKEGDDKQGQTTSKSGDAGDDVELEVTLPEGVTVDEKLLGQFKTVGKEAGLNNEGASKIAVMFAEHQKSETEAQDKRFEKQDSDWEEEISTDPDFGGAKLKASKAYARRGVELAGGEAVRKELDRLGIGNNPILFRGYARIGMAIQEDSTSAETTTSGANLSEEDRLNRRYNKSQ